MERRQLTTTGTLASVLPLPFLPFDLVAAILCRLPVKLLLQLRCLCKSFNSLISDPKFAKKHLLLSTPRHHLMVSSRNNLGDVLLFDSTIHYVLSMIPSLENEWIGYPLSIYSFGYDPFIHGYKIVAISFVKGKKEVSVRTLGTYIWRTIQDFPFTFYDDCRTGVFVSGTVNWLAYDASSSSLLFIVSLDLEKESYQKLWLPGLEKHRCILGVLNDCLCIFVSSDMFLDVWVMKEYGNKESWTKLYCVTHIKDVGSYAYRIFLHIYEYDQMLVDFHKIGHNKLNLGLYDSKNGTLKILENQNNNHWKQPEVYVESFISPCF